MDPQGTGHGSLLLLRDKLDETEPEQPRQSAEFLSLDSPGPGSL